MTSITCRNIIADLTPEELLQHALRQKEGTLSQTGALVVTTGERTGRSPKDRFIVRDNITATDVHWGSANQPIDSPLFEALWKKSLQHVVDKRLYFSQLQVGADSAHHLALKVYTETAWHNLFANHLFIKNLNADENEISWTILNIPSFKTEPQRDGVPRHFHEP